MAGKPSITKLHVERGVWTARAMIAGRDVRLLSELDAKRHDEVAASETFAHALAVVSEQWPKVVKAAAKELLATYNDTWREEDAPKLSAAGFAKALHLESINASEPDNPSRLITLYVGCGDLFADHKIECMLEWDGSPLGEPSLIG